MASIYMTLPDAAPTRTPLQGMITRAQRCENEVAMATIVLEMFNEMQRCYKTTSQRQLFEKALFTSFKYRNEWPARIYLSVYSDLLKNTAIASKLTGKLKVLQFAAAELQAVQLVEEYLEPCNNCWATAIRTHAYNVEALRNLLASVHWTDPVPQQKQALAEVLANYAKNDEVPFMSAALMALCGPNRAAKDLPSIHGKLLEELPARSANMLRTLHAYGRTSKGMIWTLKDKGEEAKMLDFLFESKNRYAYFNQDIINQLQTIKHSCKLRFSRLRLQRIVANRLKPEELAALKKNCDYKW